MQTIQLIVSGKVQGVYYRYSCREKALELGVNGTVQNLPDGSVMIVATGTEEQLKQFKNWCHKGPPRAMVNALKCVIKEPQAFFDFSILK